MTTTWKPSGEWAGETVAVLASGPSMCAELADSLRDYRTIVINETHRLAPWADMLVAMDGNWSASYRAFRGIKVTGVADATLEARYIGPRSEFVTIASGARVEIVNSGLTAIRVAADMGAARIVLAGFDPERPGHWYDDEALDYTGLRDGLELIVKELSARGVQIERI